MRRVKKITYIVYWWEKPKLMFSQKYENFDEYERNKKIKESIK